VLSLKVRTLAKIYYPSNRPNWVLLIIKNSKNTGFDSWVLLHRMDAMIRLITSETSQAPIATLWMWYAYIPFPLDVDEVMVINIIHHLIYIIFSIDSLVTIIKKPLGIHHILTKLYYLPLQRLKSLFEQVCRFSCLIQIHQNIELLASYLMSLTTGYTNPYLQIHILSLSLFWRSYTNSYSVVL